MLVQGGLSVAARVATFPMATGTGMMRGKRRQWRLAAMVLVALASARARLGHTITGSRVQVGLLLLLLLDLLHLMLLLLLVVLVLLRGVVGRGGEASLLLLVTPIGRPVARGLVLAASGAELHMRLVLLLGLERRRRGGNHGAAGVYLGPARDWKLAGLDLLLLELLLLLLVIRIHPGYGL